MTGAVLTIAGNITADPELRFTESGTPVASFNVAHTPRRMNRQTNEWEDAGETLFLRVTVWREHGENVAATLRKGAAVIVIGQLKSRSYKTREGEDRTAIEMDAEVVSIDLRRQRAQAVSRYRAGENPVDADEPWAAPTPISSAASAA